MAQGLVEILTDLGVSRLLLPYAKVMKSVPQRLSAKAEFAEAHARVHCVVLIAFASWKIEKLFALASLDLNKVLGGVSDSHEIAPLMLIVTEVCVFVTSVKLYAEAQMIVQKAKGVFPACVCCLA